MSLKDKSKLEELLKTYSINDISKVFIKIDEKLISLHECLANDFLQLNQDFKNLYNQRKLISNNISDISEFINREENTILYNYMKQFCNALNKELAAYKKYTIDSTKYISKLSELLDQLFFPIKNCSQNLAILKYLFSNIKILIPAQAIHKKDAQLKEKEINIITEKISKDLNKLQSISTFSFSVIRDSMGFNSNKQGLLLLDILSIIDELEKNYGVRKECFFQAQNKSVDSDNSISDIVKKLQYHDIIRQKMEHIQQTHQRLIDELQSVDTETSNDDKLKEKAMFFMKIRDVAGIQAAQLIQANKEYQNAIETIVNNFNVVLDSIDVLKEACVDNQLEKTKNYRNISDKIDRVEETYNIELTNNKKINSELESLVKQLNLSGKLNVSLKELHVLFQVNIKPYLNSILSKVDIDENITKTVGQIKTILKEFDDNFIAINDTVLKIEPVKENVVKHFEENQGVLKRPVFLQLKNNIFQLKQSNERIEKVIMENRSIGNSSLKQIKKSISEIEYYDYFEKVMDEIVGQLNTISINLKGSGGFSDETLSDNLDMLKEHYTVESEHSIHDKVAKGKDIDTKSKDDGEIEFF